MLMLQIIYPNGEVFRLPAGGALEIDLEDQLAKRLTEKVRFFHTANQIETAFREVFREVMFEFKDRVANP